MCAIEAEVLRMQHQLDKTQRLDVVSLLCVGAVAVGWFGMNTLVVSLGRLVQTTRFYELGVVMLHPGALFVGVGDGHGFELTSFTLLCLTTLFAAVAVPLMVPQRSAWLAGCAPLLLMLLCAALLYGNGSGTPPASPDPGLRDDVMRLAAHLLQRAQDAVVSHISVGAGGFLSALASLAMAMRSTRNFRAESVASSLKTVSSYS
jgi:hypothetical protein